MAESIGQNAVNKTTSNPLAIPSCSWVMILFLPGPNYEAWKNGN